MTTGQEDRGPAPTQAHLWARAQDSQTPGWREKVLGEHLTGEDAAACRDGTSRSLTEGPGACRGPQRAGSVTMEKDSQGAAERGPRPRSAPQPRRGGPLRPAGHRGVGPRDVRTYGHPGVAQDLSRCAPRFNVDLKHLTD